MINKISRIFLPLIIILSITSCRHEEEAIVDCVGESILVSLKDDVSNTNTKQINFQVDYSGGKTVTSVEWDFGDGSTTTTTSKNTSHTYPNPGQYEVKTNVSLDQEKCTVSPKKSITID